MVLHGIDCLVYTNIQCNICMYTCMDAYTPHPPLSYLNILGRTLYGYVQCIATTMIKGNPTVEALEMTGNSFYPMHGIDQLTAGR